MRIMMVITGMQSGGAERVMATLCNELSKDNNVRLVVLKEKKTDYKLSQEDEFIAGNIKSKLKLAKCIRFVRNEINLWKPDIVLSFMTKANIITLLSRKKNKIKPPIVIAERANPYYLRGILKYVRKKVYPKADGCVFQTKQAQAYYKDILKCKSIIIKNPLNSNFNVDRYVGERKKKIVCVARLSEEKNHKLLIDAFYRISKKNPEYILEFYGDGPLRKELEEYTKKLNISEKVFFMGRVNKIEEYIKDAKIFVLPSNSEGMPNALIEAMALGIPSIATDCPIGGPAEVINNYKNGILIPMNDLEVLEKSIEEIILNNEFANYLSLNAYKVIEDFDVEKICKEWKEYFDFIIKEKNYE